jgi:hypothetical protein
MPITLERPAVEVDDIDVRIGSTTDVTPEINAVWLTTFTNTLTQSCTCDTCSQGNCTSLSTC